MKICASLHRNERPALTKAGRYSLRSISWKPPSDFRCSQLHVGGHEKLEFGLL